VPCRAKTRPTDPLFINQVEPRKRPNSGRRNEETIRMNQIQQQRATSDGVAVAETFQVGDTAVHPAHGVGEVVGIEKRDLGGSMNVFYVLKIVDSGLKVMIPVTAAAQVGLRRVMSRKEADKVLRILRAPEVAVDLQPWNRRFRAYTEMLKSGSPYEIAKVLRDMYRLKFDKDLSFGERRLLDQAKSLLLKELALAKEVQQGAMEGEISEIFSA
jgi:CarD family transcriptional regulator